MDPVAMKPLSYHEFKSALARIIHLWASAKITHESAMEQVAQLYKEQR